MKTIRKIILLLLLVVIATGCSSETEEVKWKNNHVGNLKQISNNELSKDQYQLLIKDKHYLLNKEEVRFFQNYNQNVLNENLLDDYEQALNELKNINIPSDYIDWHDKYVDVRVNINEKMKIIIREENLLEVNENIIEYIKWHREAQDLHQSFILKEDI